MNTMPTASRCPQCGAEVSANLVQGLCPRCLLVRNLATVTQDGTQAAASQPVEPPSLQKIAAWFPQLEVLRLIGRGGMGAVYQARQPGLDRHVALKLLTPPEQGHPGFAERFTREARALARLNHANIVAVHDFGERDGHYFLLMEFVDGLNLRDLLRQKSISPAQALAIVPKICEALQFAHEQGVVHRDIKPENILLDKRGQVKIADFGIAKIINPHAPATANLTGAQDRMGTPHYMAPEQVENSKAVDHRADIYSLGVVFYELLTGELPLGRFAPPSQKVQIDVRLDEVVLRALEKEPARRFQHAVEVKTEVDTIVATPCLAEKKSPRTTRRLWLAAAGIVLLATLAVAGLLLFRPPVKTGDRPVVVSTFPASGAVDVEPGERTISVTFDRPMDPRGYTWGYAWEDSVPQVAGQPWFSEDRRTCFLKAILLPGRKYGYMINTGGRYNNFKDETGRPSVPYLFYFTTKPEATGKTASPQAMPGPSG